MSVIHLRNGRAERRPHVRGDGVTWCGKKLLGEPVRKDGLVTTFSSYGAELSATLDLDAGTCPTCRMRFDAAYERAFPEGPKPIATFRLDSAEDMERARAALRPEALTKFFAPGGSGMPAFEAALSSQEPSA